MHVASRRKFLCATLGAGAAFGLHRADTSNSPRTIERSGRALGTLVSISVLHADGAAAELALQAAFGELETVEEVMSLYRPQSQISRLNGTGLLSNPHPYLIEVLCQAQRLARQSHGAFDVSVQPLWMLHATASKSGRTPTSAELAAARAQVDWRRLEISPECVRLAPGMAVTLNGIAQGFATDRALDALRRAGIEHALVNTGELGSLGHNAEGQTWTAGIQHPRIGAAYIALAKLDGRRLATSGDYATPFTPDRREHHIFDPRSGHSPTELASVSVLAPTGLEADGLSTTLFVLGLSRSRALIDSLPGVDAFFVLKEGGVWATRGFPEPA